jgi:hypothetical protein
VRTIKLFAVIGLAVALVAVPALTQQQPKVVNVTCDTTNNKIKVSLNPVVLVIKFNETARWVFSSDLGACKVKDQKLDPNGQPLQALGLNNIKIVVARAELIKLEPNPVSWPSTPQQASAITGTPLQAGTTEYSIQFLRDNNVLLEVRQASNLEIVVSTPTLTEWGLIALAVLLAGGMGYMIYRRRPALRPAAP